MILKLGARCRCKSEIVGSLHGVSVEPQERIVLQLIIEQPQASPLVRVRLPFGRVDLADADQISIAMIGADFRTLPEYGGSASKTPRRPARGARSDGPDERILTARTRVECRDGLVGNLSHLLVDPRTGDITGLAFPFGVHFQRNVQVPSSQVSSVSADVIELHFDMDEIESLPTLRT